MVSLEQILSDDVGIMIDHDESMDRKEKWEQCSQKAKPFTEIFREAGKTEGQIKNSLLTYLAKDWFRCHICRKHFEEDQNIWKHMEEEEWCHEECRGTPDKNVQEDSEDSEGFIEQTVSNPSIKTGIDLQIWRKGQRGFDTTGGGW